MWIEPPLEEMKSLFDFYIFISLLWCQSGAMPPKLSVNGEMGTLTQGSLCLPCCVQCEADLIYLILQ